MLSRTKRTQQPINFGSQATSQSPGKNLAVAPLKRQSPPTSGDASHKVPLVETSVVRLNHTEMREESIQESCAIGTSNPFKENVPLGKLTQLSEFIICKRSDIQKVQKMFKRTKVEEGRLEFQMLNLLRHSNIIALSDSYIYDGQFFLGLEYCRYTLAEILCVPQRLEQVHLEIMISSIFTVLQSLYKQRITHNRITPNSIRVCGFTGRVILSDFDRATQWRAETNVDLDSFGTVLLRCMNAGYTEGGSWDCGSLVQPFDKRQLRLERWGGTLYGLNKRAREKWGKSSVIGFVDSLFDVDRPVSSKMEIVPPSCDRSVLDIFRHHTDMINLHCHQEWESYL